MKKKVYLLITLFLFSFDCSCGTNKKQDDKVDSLYAIKDSLYSNNVEYELTKSASSEFAGEKYGFVYKNENIYIYVYENEKDAVTDLERISADGCVYNKEEENNLGRQITYCWTADPHYFQKDNYLLLYVGENKDVLAFMGGMFGEQVI